MATSILFLVLQVLAPLLAFHKRWQPTRLFAVVMLVYAVCGGAGLMETKMTIASSEGTDLQFHDFFYAWSRAHLMLNFALVTGLFATITWLQTRFGAMLYPRTTTALIGIFHLSLVAGLLYPWVLAFFWPEPENYFQNSGLMKIHLKIQVWSSLLSSAAIVGLLGLLVWSTLLTIYASRKNARDHSM